jgi:hypothetical protein
MMEFGDTDEGSVVPHLSITVGGEAIFVPLSVYSRLSNIKWVSLSYKNGSSTSRLMKMATYLWSISILALTVE